MIMIKVALSNFPYGACVWKIENQDNSIDISSQYASVDFITSK